MDLIFSNHALDRIKARGISKELIFETIRNFDSEYLENDCMKIYQKKIITDEKTYLLRVFINICSEPDVVVTAYKTSKVEKYEN